MGDMAEFPFQQQQQELQTAEQQRQMLRLHSTLNSAQIQRPEISLLMQNLDSLLMTAGYRVEYSDGPSRLSRRQELNYLLAECYLKSNGLELTLSAPRPCKSETYFITPVPNGGFRIYTYGLPPAGKFSSLEVEPVFYETGTFSLPLSELPWEAVHTKDQLKIARG